MSPGPGGLSPGRAPRYPRTVAVPSRMRRTTSHDQVSSAVREGGWEGGAFFGSIVSGTLLGYLADMWLGTEPWLVITGVVIGSYSGFLRMWHYSK